MDNKIEFLVCKEEEDMHFASSSSLTVLDYLTCWTFLACFKGCWTLVQLTWWLSFSLGWCLLAFGDLLCLLSRWLWRVRVLRIKTCSSSELSQSNARMASNVWGDFWPLDDERSHASEATDARYSSVHHERSQNPSQNGLLFKDCLSNAIERVFVRFWQENC